MGFKMGLRVVFIIEKRKGKQWQIWLGLIFIDTRRVICSCSENRIEFDKELLEVNAYLLLFIPAAKAIIAVVRKPQDQSVESPDSVSLTAVK